MSRPELELVRDLKCRCFMVNKLTNPDFDFDREAISADNRLVSFHIRNDKLVRFTRKSPANDFLADRSWKDEDVWRDLAVNHRDETSRAVVVVVVAGMKPNGLRAHPRH